MPLKQLFHTRQLDPHFKHVSSSALEERKCSCLMWEFPLYTVITIDNKGTALGLYQSYRGTELGREN